MNAKTLQKTALMTIAACATLFTANAEAREADQLPVERYALYVASNDGGSERETLKYAVTDAVRLSRTMNEIGGIKGQNSLILSNPTSRDINDAFADFAALVSKNTGKSKRSEFLFYYSGHSDEKSFLLGTEAYSYSTLKAAIDRIPSDVHVVMLDSCYSGNFVRAKGGSRQKPFLMDDSSIVQGHAYLSSSSGFESSQESDRIQASYFTHALVTGLRGAADASGDSKVSLNELYHYAFNETLSQTELSSSGPQHPSYDITLVGSGDLVLTDISVAESSVYIGKPYSGKYYIRDTNGTLVSELNKVAGTEITLALPAGSYIITIVSDLSTLQGTVTLGKGERLALANDSFTPVSKLYGRSRGDEPGDADPAAEKPLEWTTFSLALVPGLAFPEESDNANISLGAIWATNDNINGLQANVFGGTVKNSLSGFQASGFLNILNGDMKGIQSAGFINVARGHGEIVGAQMAGYMNTTSAYIKGGQLSGFLNRARDGFYGVQGTAFLNVAGGSSRGVQAAAFLNVADEISGVQVGFINVARKNTGASIGFLNFILEGVMSPAVYVNSNGTMYVQYQGGTNRFFTTFIVGTDITGDPDFIETGFGIGTRLIATKHISFDIEILSKNVSESFNDGESEITIDDEESFTVACNAYGKTHIPSLRLTAQYSFFKHLSAFAAFEGEMMFEGYNNEAFSDYGRHYMHIEMVKDGFTLYPTFALGIKF